MRGYPRGFLAIVWLSMITASLTGILLIPNALNLKFAMDIPTLVVDTWLEYLPMLHALFSFWLLMVVGSLWSVHMRMGWRRRKNRLTGTLLIVGFLMLFFSAIGLYYAVDDRYLNYSSAIHIMSGLVLMMIMLIHYIAALKEK